MFPAFRRLATPRPVLGLLFASASLFGQTNVLTYHNDNLRTGQNLSETILTPQNVQSSKFGKLFTLPVDGRVDAQPLLVSGLAIPNQGTHNVVFVATEHDSVYAFDSDTGVKYWQVSLLKAGETPSDSRQCGQVAPEIGITGTPVIDLSAGPHGTVYVVAMSKDAGGVYHQRFHALDISTGAEEFNGPVEVQATYPGTGDNSSNGVVVFDAKKYKSRPGLLLINGIVYTSWGSHCDSRPYTGWVIGYDRTTLAQKSVFNFAPNGEGAAVWGAGGGIAADSSGTLYFQLGNGTFDTTLTAGFPNKADYGNAFVKLGAGTNVLDYWTMFNTVSESNADEDLGSGGVLLVPDVVDNQGQTRHLGVGAGKDGDIYMFDRDNMGKFNPANNGNLYQEVASGLGGAEFASPAWFNGTLYFGAVNDVLRAYKMNQARLASSPASASPTAFTFPGTTPAVSANGASNGIVWAAENSNPGVLHAYNPDNLAQELYNSNQAAGGRDQYGPGNKFITPMIANGKVYVGHSTGVAVFGLLGPALSSISPNSGTQGTAPPVTLNGANFVAGATVAITGAGVTVSNVSVVNAGQITATFTIDASAAPGSRTVTVTTSSGTSNGVSFAVSATNAAPTLSSVNPSTGQQGAAVPVTLNGTNFTAASTVTVSGAGIAVSNVTVVNSAQITATFTIASNATIGAHNVTVTTVNGVSNSQPFNVTGGAAGPTLTSVAPSTGAQGTNVQVTLNGSNFNASSAISVTGTGVGVHNVTLVNAGQLSATFAIAASAEASARTVTVTTSGGTSNGQTFTVVTPGRPPTLSSVTPNSGARGTAVNVTLTGTNFVAGAAVLVGAANVTVSNVTVVSPTEITATINLGANATTGTHNVRVTTANGYSNAQSFTIN